MRTVQMTIDDTLVQEMEQRHRQGYRRKPVQKGEFSDWEDEQVWVD